MPSNKTMVDVVLFLGTAYVIYEYGTDIAKSAESLIPSEKDILEMMQQQ
jgi:hypothetical protein